MDASTTTGMLERARRGESGALSELFAAHHARLVRMIHLRLDARLRRRLDPSDVVQEAWLEVVRRFPAWSVDARPPFSVWVRLTTAQALANVRRKHLDTRQRDAQRDTSVASRTNVSATNAADAFVASATSPSRVAHRHELRARVLQALEELDELDREIVVLRQFEELSNEEAALELSIEPSAASKRFARALVRLRPALEALRHGISTEGA